VIRWDNTAAPTSEGPSRAKPFSLPALGGGTVELGPLIGKRPIVLVFWASWCQPCLAEAPHLQALHEELGDEVSFISVAIDDEKTKNKLIPVVRRLKLGYPVALDTDGAVFGEYAAGSTIPLTLLIDKSGAVVGRRTNFESGDEAELAEAVRALR